MKIKKISVENFRSIKTLDFDFRDLTVLIGENNAGKTNILKALDAFFSPTVRNINKECFFDLTKEIQITVTFNRLTSQERERIGKYLINDYVVVKRSFAYDPRTDKMEAKFSGLIREPRQSFLKLSKFEEYKDRLSEIVRQQGLPDYFKTERNTVTQASYIDGLRRYIEEKINEIEWDEPFFSDTHFLGWKEVATSYIPHFFYIPAVKEASEEAEYGSSNLFGRLIDSILEFCGGTPEFSRISSLLEQAQNLLNRPSTGQPDARPTKMKELEKALLDILKEEMPSTGDLEIRVGVPTIDAIFTSGTGLIIDDGVKTTIESKGHGLQRAVIFAIFRQYANLAKQNKAPMQESKPCLFAIEEPELYLHPHGQRALLKILHGLAETEQVIFCTHSTFCIDMSHYTSLVIVNKPDAASGTRIFQTTEEIFSGTDKEYFRLLNEFDPERNELFFAKKVILVEGDCEKIAFPMIAQKVGIDLNVKGISVIECGGKLNLTFFMKLLNKFRIPYAVVHDIDPINQNWSADKKREMRKFFDFNKTILDHLDLSIGKVFPLNPDFEEVLGISARHAEIVGKPFASFERTRSIAAGDIPLRIKRIIEFAST